ncbi:hypothetical protein C7B76_17620 [filamentous cyanobacterium CCP2]|nr:hypothetical protein C7B76_17620 [filamentous cyanobacterium CCP2]
MNRFHQLVKVLRSQHPSQPRSPHPCPDQGSPSVKAIRQRIALEHLRQAKCTFNLSLVMMSVSAIVLLRGDMLLPPGQSPEGAIVAVAQLLSGATHLQLVKDANSRLEKSAAALRDEQGED